MAARVYEIRIDGGEDALKERVATHPVTLAEVDPAEHDDLVEQYRIEQTRG